MKSNKFRLNLALVFLAALTLGTFVFGVAKTYADPGGRPWGYGYFDNKYWDPGSGGWLYTPVFGSGVYAGLSTTSNGGTENKSKFLSFMNGKLNNNNRQDNTGAAFLIDLMMPGNSRNR